MTDLADQRELTDKKTRYWASVWPAEIFAINEFREWLYLPRLTAKDLNHKLARGSGHPRLLEE